MGCSLQAWIEILAPYGYELFQVEWQDLVFVRHDLRRFLSHFELSADVFTKWKVGTFCRSPGRFFRGYQENSP